MGRLEEELEGVPRRDRAQKPSPGPVLSPDVSGDGVKGSEGGNPDPLQVVEKGRAAGLWAGWLEEEPM